LIFATKHWASPIRGEIGFAHGTQVGTQLSALLMDKRMFALTTIKFVYEIRATGND